MVSCIDFRYITDALTEQEALGEVIKDCLELSFNELLHSYTVVHFFTSFSFRYIGKSKNGAET